MAASAKTSLNTLGVIKKWGRGEFLLILSLGARILVKLFITQAGEAASLEASSPQFYHLTQP